VLQLMAELESMEPWKSNVTAKHSLLQKLLARGPSSDQAEEEDVSFVHGLLYHPSGSHLLEAIIRFAPGKVFRNIYRNMLREKLAEAAKNDVANFVVIRVLERVGKDELQDVINMLLPVFPELARRSRSAVIRAVIERCVARKLDLDPVAKAIESAYEGQSASEKLGRMLKWEGGAAGPKKKDDSSGDNNNGGGGSKHTDTLSLLRNPQPPPGRLHGSLLAQTMLHQPGALSSFVCEGLLDTPTATLADMAEDAAASRLLQAALVLPTPTVVPTAPTMAARASAAPPPPAPAFRRRLLAAFVGVAARLALHPVGWHVLDAMWESTRGLPHCRERIAHELLAQQAALGASFTGRRVWRVWQMNLFRERRARWMALAKTGGEGGAAGGGGGGGGGGRGGDGGGGGRGGGERGAANGQERNGTMRRGRK
jgi:nucleolar protein 9